MNILTSDTLRSRRMISRRRGPGPTATVSPVLSWRVIGQITQPLRRLLVPAGFPLIRMEGVTVALDLSARHGSVVTLGYVGPLTSGYNVDTFKTAFGAIVDTLPGRFEREACFTNDWADGVASLARYIRADLIVAIPPSPALADRLSVAAMTLQRPLFVGLPMEGAL